MRGIKVFTPMGWDAFGLPAENAARERGLDPEKWTIDNIQTMRKCFKALDLKLDWDSEINTSSPDYYHWTQWLFLQLYSKGLAYQKQSLVNWDPIDQTVLANEQVDQYGVAERSGAMVEKKFMKQWFFKITNYASRLHQDLDKVDWPLKVKQQQRKWIRMEKGASVRAMIYDLKSQKNVPSEIFVAEKDFLKAPRRLLIGTRNSLVSNFDFTKLNKGSVPYKMDHLRLKDPYDPKLDDIPVYLSTDIPDEEAVLEVKKTICESDISFDEWVRQKCGRKETKYRLRDWLISRQRRWGTPIPIIHCGSCGPVPVPEENLPVIWKSDEEIKVQCPKCGSTGTRETDTMDTFVDSSWYWARFIDSRNSSRIVDKIKASKFLPVDIYIGGIEHSILHLLYARFVGKFMNDEQIISLPDGEPFSKLITVGMVQGKTFKDKSGRYYLESDCISCESGLKSINDGAPISITYEKMSKSKGNGVDPLEILEKYNSDILRLYICSRVGMEEELRWEESSIIGMSRWLKNCDKLFNECINAIGTLKLQNLENEPITENQLKTMKKVTDCFTETWNFHNAISALIIDFNNLKKSKLPWTDISKLKQLITFIQMMHPFAPAWTSKIANGHGIPLNWPKN